MLTTSNVMTVFIFLAICRIVRGFLKETAGEKSCCVTRLTMHIIITGVNGDTNANLKKLFDKMSVIQKCIEPVDSRMGGFVNEITEVKGQISSIKKGNEEIRSKQ